MLSSPGPQTLAFYSLCVRGTMTGWLKSSTPWVRTTGLPAGADEFPECMDDTWSREGHRKLGAVGNVKYSSLVKDTFLVDTSRKIEAGYL